MNCSIVAKADFTWSSDEASKLSTSSKYFVSLSDKSCSELIFCDSFISKYTVDSPLISISLS